MARGRIIAHSSQLLPKKSKFVTNQAVPTPKINERIDTQQLI